MHQMMQVVPKFDHRLREILFIGKCAQTRGAQQEIFPSLGFQPQPTCRQHAQKVPARKNQNILL
jgi:hypothetical protein